MVKKGKKSKVVQKVSKKSMKRPIKTSVKKRSNPFSKKPKMAKSKKKRTKYMLQEALVRKAKEKAKEKAVEFIEKHPAIEKAIMKTAAAERKIAQKTVEGIREFVQDTKTVSGYLADRAKGLFKPKPKTKVEQESLIKTSQEAAAQQTERSYTLKVAIKYGSVAIMLPKELTNKEEIKVESEPGEEFDSTIKNKICELNSNLNPDKVLVIYKPSKQLVEIKISP